MDDIYGMALRTLGGEPVTLEARRGHTLLLVNTASRCGFTPQYRALELLQQTYASRGFSVLGFPCNQFGGQEPGSPAEIQLFCSTAFRITFPLFEKTEVNGAGRHPLFEALTAVEDETGRAGDVEWNFEKFLIGPDGTGPVRFRSQVPPDAPAVTGRIEEALTRGRVG